MKSKIVFLIVFAVVAQITHAQKFGIKGGLNVANVSFPGNENGFFESSVTGFHMGPIVDYKLIEKLYFNSGLLYSIKGSMINSISDHGGAEYVPLKTNNMVIPLNIAYKFFLNEKSRFFVQGGTYLGYTLNGKIRFAGKDEKLQFGGDGHMKRFDFGLSMGTGFQIGSLITSLNYESGLSEPLGPKIKNRVLQLSLVYMFGN